MPSVAEAQRRQASIMNSSIGISPLSMGFPVDVETTERRRQRKQQEEQKKRISPDDVSSYRPSSTGIHSHIIWQHATMKGYLTKHIPPVFSFTKNKKRRYVILADRFLYCFKTDVPTNKYREFMELGPDTQAFVTDHLSGVLYCIEIRKPGIDATSWFLQAEDADGMKIWLERLKKTIQYLADNKDDKGPITKEKLHFVHSPEDLFFLNGGIYHPHANDSNSLHGTSSSGDSSSINMTPRSSQHEIDTSTWRHSGSTNWTDPHSPSTTSGSNYACSPPMSPSTATMNGSFSSSSVSTPTSFNQYQQLHHINTCNTNGGRIQRNDSMRSSLSQEDYHHTSRINSLRSLPSPRLPDSLPPALPPPTSSLPPPPTHI
ncbi:uncharacterized protein BX664DRAFT_319068 [Halteromyces radiatus]|uniref:uncharacterized protein n=1 Tax=Halteromyces radiatus TaxID=101107 RepID=UPI002220B6C0|nr:uncharacterized protein BX664DRAFT_319068 [Halteromyces radiatus]KAI8098582.1 hypothetical protein BX664DRAFT_319068 [Halteromyces radiatus]